jgi:hypothetical protein
MAAIRTVANKLVRSQLAAAALLPVVAIQCESRADTDAHFWLSDANGVRAVPVMYVLPGSTNQIQVWGRPAVGYRLTAFSLNLESETAGVISFSNVTVINPTLQARPTLRRHQLAFDSTVGLEPTSDLIDGFLGFSFFQNAIGLPDGAGIGPFCGIDPDCSSSGGFSSWRLATIEYQAGLSFGSTEFYLEISEQGLWQSLAGATEPDDPWDTSAVFGLADDTVNQWTIEAVGGVDDRGMHVGAADALIVVASADFDENGYVDGADFLIWQRGLGVGTMHADGDADGDGDVDQSDLAAWRFQHGATEAVLPAGSFVSEPAGSVVVVALFAASWRHRRRRSSLH